MIYFTAFRSCGLDLSPLRDQVQDIPSIASQIVHDTCARFELQTPEFAPEAMDILRRYEWPGNLQEMSQIICRALFRCNGSTITPADLAVKTVGVPMPSKDLPSLANVEAEHIRRVLHATGGNKRETSDILRINRATLNRKLERYNITGES